MATYAIGDIQGCFDELQQLLKQIDFNPETDHLWFAGDLVNRGPKSLEVLRFVKGLGESATTVLGNHDLHLLALWRGFQRNAKENDSLAPILNAADCDDLLEWLSQQPLMHHDADLGYALVHAGLPPQWSIKKALKYAAEVEAVLTSNRLDEFFTNMYGDKPNRWSKNLEGWERIRFIVNCFTRIRFCTARGKLNLKMKGGLGSATEEYLPWFQIPGRKSRKHPIIFGHWSTLQGHYEENIYAIDTGCLWGGSLTALRIDTPLAITHECHCHEFQKPDKVNYLI
ncbi:MAG: symmetrical bis(5'-nucleosyl)-tetraphosphatase [Gammaproteobacteria bacterium]|nr:symmetrical bis(5'-nucleosyl)-tetraphosphatase [Gammaproteobacteria bacterium]